MSYGESVYGVPIIMGCRCGLPTSPPGNRPAGMAVRPSLLADPHLGSATDVSASTAIRAAAIAAEAVAGTVGLVTERVDVQDVEPEAAPAVTTIAAHATIATTAGVIAAHAAALTATATAGVEQRQDGTGRQQLHMLPIDLHKAQCVRHQILLGNMTPGGPGGQNTSSVALPIRQYIHCPQYGHAAISSHT